MTRCTPITLLVAALLAAGCGRDGPPVPVHPATGAVTFRGQPAAGLVVQFCPADEALARKIGGPASALVGPSGTFTAGTFAPGDGLPAGTYKLAFFWTGRTAAELERKGELAAFEQKYGVPGALARTIEVREGPNPIDPISLD